jgi:hypothetical protein
LQADHFTRNAAARIRGGHQDGAHVKLLRMKYDNV